MYDLVARAWILNLHYERIYHSRTYRFNFHLHGQEMLMDYMLLQETAKTM